MNNYQAQQMFNDINGIIGFFTSIVALGFMVGMTKLITEEPKRIWLVYVTPEGKWGAWDISPAKPTLAIYKEDPKKYLKEWGEYYYLDAEAQVARGRFANYWISEATTRYRAIRNVQVMALPEHHSYAWRGKGNLIDVIRKQVKAEIEWGEGREGMKLWSAKNEGLRRRDEASWGKIENGYVILFHGTDSSIIPRILQEGIVQRYEMIGKIKEELTKEEWEDVREMGFGYAVWFAATPYGAFFYNDTALQVKIPLSWISYFDESGFMVERNIPPEMIVKIIPFREWTGEEWSG